MADITVVIVHYRTPDLLARAVRSLRAPHPEVPLLIIDNGSGKTSASALHDIVSSTGPTRIHYNERNLHHGGGMDQAFSLVATSFVLFLDSDCEVLTGGCIEGMIEAFSRDPSLYAAGKRIFMNRRGFDIPETPGAHPYIRPICMMIRTSMYGGLPRFAKHGAPCLANMIGAVDRGYALAHFPIEDFVRHEGRGTAGRHGYRLGLRGKWNHLMNSFGL